MKKDGPRFTKSLREHARRDGSTDRYWVVEDRKQRGFTVLKVNASYPGAEALATKYLLKLSAQAAMMRASWAKDVAELVERKTMR
jgi:hypothetical protein